MEKILFFFGGILVFGSCSAMIATPVTTPLWFIVGLIFLFSSQVPPLWRGLTLFHSIAFAFITLLGMLGVVTGGRLTNNDNALLNSPVFPFIGLAITLATAWIYYAAWPRQNTEIFKGWIVAQLGVAIAAFLYVMAIVTDVWPQR